MRHKRFNESNFIRVTGFDSSNSYSKDSNMSNSTVVGNGLKSFNTEVLHRGRKQSGENSFSRGTFVVEGFKFLTSVIDGLANRFIEINPTVSYTAITRHELRQTPGTGWMSFSKFFRAFDRADKFMPDSILIFIPEFSSRDHFETGDTNGDSFIRESKSVAFSSSGISGNNRFGFQVKSDEVNDSN